jgi:hypothetical protein
MMYWGEDMKAPAAGVLDPRTILFLALIVVPRRLAALVRQRLAGASDRSNSSGRRSSTSDWPPWELTIDEHERIRHTLSGYAAATRARR